MPGLTEEGLLAMGHDSQLTRGLRALEVLAAGPLSAAEIGRRLGVERSTALRMCRELEALGYVTRNKASKRYEIVPTRLYALAGGRRGARDWNETIDPVLSRLRDQTREASVFGVPAGNCVVYVAFCESLQPIAVREHLGAARPMHASALGKAYLAALSPGDLDVELGRLDYSGGTDKAARGPIELRQRLDAVRSCGYALDSEETFEDVACVAVPVHLAGKLLGAIGISGPISRLPKHRLERLGEQLCSEVRMIE